ncbi:MAG: cupin domain-containing protein [Alicyclobacillus sp.]|nr:cupin domain-containing protein [Alicyclobacillus sp.]
MKAREIFTPDRGGERRAIYLQNPGLRQREPWGWASTTQTLYAAVQLILPGEAAPSHRHSQSALRFILNGKGAYTIVQGERVFMEEGDFLTTPQYMWHGHAHTGDEPMIWMDVLDIPLIYGIGGTFFEPYPDRLEPPSVPDNASAQRYQGGMVRPVRDRQPSPAPLKSFKWDATQRALLGMGEVDLDPCDGFAVEFINPSTAQPAHPNIGSWMQRLPAGFKGRAHRHTYASIYCVFRGSGYTVINGTRFTWSKGDFFVVPNWAWHEHVNTGTEDAYLFTVNDLPVMEKFNLQKEEVHPDGYQAVRDTFQP